ncbi:hypothetical protein B0A49_13123 [Cryomyces minteri]|uniref:Blue (type 1) copper domain-containing protein n=1 Tax=Cryomyces minteri TaxID=331657 RepID=A0A4U0WLT5_9PEZI|nr:hypothetical protein B0A49_13123 [Cryomyces minteri]
MFASVGLAQLLSVATAQTTSASPSSAFWTATATTSSAVQTHTVTVGKGDNKFVPDVVLANAGDIIQYQFFPPNHSVARAEYLSPYIPYEDTGVDKVGFFSGFQAVDAILNNPPTYNLRINDTNPVFFYCTAPGSCIGHGMIGVINPNESVSLAKQRALAMQAAVTGKGNDILDGDYSDVYGRGHDQRRCSEIRKQPIFSQRPLGWCDRRHRDWWHSGLAARSSTILPVGAYKDAKEVIHNNQGGPNRLSGPDMLHSNGAQFIPVTPAGYRKSGKGLGDVVSYQKPQEESIRDNLSDHSTSPIMPYHNSLQFGNFYPQEALSNPQNMLQNQRFSDSSGFEVPHPPVVNSQDLFGGPHELSTPLMYDNRQYRSYRPTEQ